jgi:hypothetical protein
MLISNCSNESTKPEETVFPDSNLSFSQHIHPVFLQNCAFSGCHSNVNPQNDLDLETLTPTFNSINGRVLFEFNADQSRLYLVLLGSYQGINRMPRNRAPLSNATIIAIRTWINEGAIINN